MCVLGNIISCGMPARHTPVNKGRDLEVLLPMGVQLGVVWRSPPKIDSWTHPFAPIAAALQVWNHKKEKVFRNFGLLTPKIGVHLAQFNDILGRRSTKPPNMRPIVTDRVAWFEDMSVCRSVCGPVTLVSPAKTAAPIEMPFVLRTLVGPRNHVLDGIQNPHGKGQ